MNKYLKAIVLGIILLSLAGCDIETPEIRGIVLDAETKQPVANAWISATLQLESMTIAGDVTRYVRIEPPHTRTNKDGKFIIPPTSISASAGTSIDGFSLNASTIDDKSGGFYLKDYKEGKEAVIYVKTWEKGLSDEKEYFSYVQSLHNYCLTGRFGVEVPAVKGGCDEWELDYAITKHERYLERYRNPKAVEQKAMHANTLNQLGYLYEKKQNFQKAIVVYRQLMDFEGKDGWFFKSSENKINELQQKHLKK